MCPDDSAVSLMDKQWRPRDILAEYDVLWAHAAAYHCHLSGQRPAATSKDDFV